MSDGYPNETILDRVTLDVEGPELLVSAMLRTTELDAKGRRKPLVRRRRVSFMDASIDAETLLDIVHDLRVSRPTLDPPPASDAQHWTALELRDDKDGESVRAITTVQFVRELAQAIEVTIARVHAGHQAPAQRVDLLYQGEAFAERFTVVRSAAASEVGP